MKTIINKTLAVIFLIMLFNNISYSYIIEIIKPKPCPGNPSFLHFPSFTQQCEFIIHKQQGDSSTILYKIIVEQNGNSLQMEEGVCYDGETVYRTINLQNFTQLCFNEILTVRIDARAYNGGGVTNSERGYLIVYKNELSCRYSSITNGTTELLTPNYIPVTFYSRCGALASSVYFIKRYKKTFTLYGNFRDSMPEVEKSLCLGYSGAGPNNQERWGAIIEHSDNHVKFITFVYEVINVLGQNFGWVPCRPEEATVVFKYVSEPIISNLTAYPNFLNLTNSTSIATCNLTQGYENAQFQWRDSNATVYPIHFYNLQPDKIKIVADFGDRTVVEREADPAYFVFVRAFNNYGSTGWVKRKVMVYRTLLACPLIKYEMNDTKIYENSVIVGSNGEFKSDYYLHTNPELQSQTSIDFKIEESGKDLSYIDQVVLSQVKVKKGEYAAVADNGEVINYNIGSAKAKILINDENDVSDALTFNDGEDIKLEKGDKLNVDVKVDGGGYIIISSHIPVNKDAIAGIITTNNGNRYTFLSRDNENLSCIKLKESSITKFNIIAEQSFAVDQLLLVKAIGTAEIKDLSLKSAIHDKFGNVSDLLSKEDGSLVEISKDLSLSLEFDNEESDEHTSFYVQKTVGRVIKSDYQVSDEQNGEKNFRFDNKLHENSPNPFNPSTNIKYEIPIDGFVNLKVYDVSGRVVNTIVSEYKTAGRHEVTFDGSNFASGIYFYRIETNGFRDTKRMILIK